MQTRELPPQEWNRLEGTPLGEVWQQLPTSGLAILAVEGDDGQVIGHWTEFAARHAEQVWVRPDHQKRGAVARHLLRAMYARVAAAGASAFITHSASDEVTAILVGLGASPLPGMAYSVPVPRR